MTKKLTVVIALLILSVSVFGQDVKNDQQKTPTKMELFSSKSGVIIKFIDTKTPNLKYSYGGLETRIRKISNGGTEDYFYQIIINGKIEASIEYSGLLEIIKAMDILKDEYIKDDETNPYYIENHFIMDDGFGIGYYIKKGYTTWYIKFDNYDKPLPFMNSSDNIDYAFANAKNNIESLKLKK